MEYDNKRFCSVGGFNKSNISCIRLHPTGRDISPVRPVVWFGKILHYSTEVSIAHWAYHVNTPVLDAIVFQLHTTRATPIQAKGVWGGVAAFFVLRLVGYVCCCFFFTSEYCTWLVVAISPPLWFARNG